MPARVRAVRSGVDGPSITPTEILGVTFAVVLGFGALCCAVAFKGLPRLLYRCRRCEREFRRAPYRPFPNRCPSCGAHDRALPR